MRLFHALMQRRVAWDNDCLKQVLLHLGAILAQQYQHAADPDAHTRLGSPIHRLALQSVEAGWVAGLKRILKDAATGVFLPDNASRDDAGQDEAGICHALLQGGAVHIAAACCHDEMLAFLLELDSSDPLLNTTLRIPASEALCQPLNLASMPQILQLKPFSQHFHDWQVQSKLGSVCFPPLALALAWGGWKWGKRKGEESGEWRVQAGSDAFLRTLAILVKQGAPVDAMWKTERCGLLNWEDLVVRFGHGRAAYELLVKASSRSGAEVNAWLERAERDGQLDQLIADLEHGEGQLDVSKATSSTDLLARRHRAVEQLAACQADIKPHHRAKLNELALELCQGRDDDLAPRRVELLCLLLQKRLVLLEEHDARGTSVGSQLLFAAASANAAATVAQPHA